MDYAPEARRVRLVRGEVHFVVAKNPERPFFVSAGEVSVRAVGTAFNVRLATGRIEVLVTEGKVRLEGAGAAAPAAANPAPTRTAGAPEPGAALVVGPKAVITREAVAAVAAVAVGEVGRAEIDAELGWQSTRLVFSNTPLDEVIDGFNHYNPHRLILGDPSLRERALTGVFRADNREGFVRLLRTSVDVKAVERGPLETVVLPVR